MPFRYNASRIRANPFLAGIGVYPATRVPGLRNLSLIDELFGKLTEAIRKAA